MAGKKNWVPGAIKDHGNFVRVFTWETKEEGVWQSRIVQTCIPTCDAYPKEGYLEFCLSLLSSNCDIVSPVKCSFEYSKPILRISALKSIPL